MYDKKWYYNNKDKAIGWIRDRRTTLIEYINQYKENHPCILCKESCTVCLDFHHKDEKLKTIEIARVASLGWSIEKIQKEIDKCVILCSNCHRKLHAGLVILPDSSSA